MAYLELSHDITHNRIAGNESNNHDGHYYDVRMICHSAPPTPVSSGSGKARSPTPGQSGHRRESTTNWALHRGAYEVEVSSFLGGARRTVGFEKPLRIKWRKPR